MTDAMQPTRSRILERVRLVITEPSTHELDTADLVWLYSIALATVDEAGENAGLTQASDSLARISNYVNESSSVGERIEKVGRALLSSHPEDGGIREALEKLKRALRIAEPFLDPGMVRIRGIYGTHNREDAVKIVTAALNPAPLPIGEERGEKN